MNRAVVSSMWKGSGIPAAKAITIGMRLAVSLTIAPHVVYAESVEYQGRDFPVDNIRVVEGANVAIDVGGQAIFATRETAGRLIFKIYARRPELLQVRNAFDGYGSWLGALSAKGDGDEAALGVTQVLISPELGPRDKKGFYSELVGNAEGEKLLFDSVQLSGGGNGEVCGSLAFLSLPHQLTLQKDTSPELSWLVAKCPQALVATARWDMMEGDVSLGTATLRATSTIFAGRDPAADAAKVSLERIALVEDAIRSQDIARFDSALKVATFDGLLGEYFEKQQPRLVTEFSDQALRDHRPLTALQGLSLLDFGLRNNKHHELVSKALDEVGFQDRAGVEQQSVRTLLWSYATKDDDIRRKYISKLEEWVARLLEEGKPDEALALFISIKDLRLDPSPENDILRGDIAEALLDIGHARSADSLLAGVRTELPWLYRFRILMKRDILMFAMVALGCLVVVRWILLIPRLVRAKSVERRIAVEAERRAAEAAERERYRAQFEGRTLTSGAFMDVDEYAAGLKKFNLRPNASLADIKNAYRNVVKRLHPDINPQVTQQDTDSFIDLTKTYERLLILYEERERRSKPSQ
jgi:hypothetical protein